jgi:hypothetical protein
MCESLRSHIIASNPLNQVPATAKAVVRLYVLSVISLAVSPRRPLLERLFERDPATRKYDLCALVQKYLGVSVVRIATTAEYCAVALGSWLSESTMDSFYKDSDNWKQVGSVLFDSLNTYQRKVRYVLSARFLGRGHNADAASLLFALFCSFCSFSLGDSIATYV